MMDDKNFWPEADEQEVSQVEEYELTSSPNDFNVLTIFSFIESGAVKIPGFQRHYVWDIKRASKLVESLVIGLPVPQIFLYEESKNSFLVIDGQQRLMSIYYFMKGRFPRKEKRAELRKIFAEHGRIPEEVLHDDVYFEKFHLRLADIAASRPNKFSGRNYQTLDQYRSQFDLRTIRNVIVKQNVPSDDDSSIYEMFNRLNTGGINLTPQEIRASLYHSDFFDLLYRLNLRPEWRRFLSGQEPDIHMRDIEILVRAFAMLMASDRYTSSMAKFLNRFSKSAKSFDQAMVSGLQGVFERFLFAAADLPSSLFISRTGRFSITLFEAVFYAAGKMVQQSDWSADRRIKLQRVELLRVDAEFVEASDAQSTNKRNVETRLRRARDILSV